MNTKDIKHRTQTFRLIWLRTNTDKSNEDFNNIIIKLKHQINFVDTFTDIDQCIDFLTDLTESKVLMIASKTLIHLLISSIHDVPQLDSIFIYPDDNKDVQQQWSKIKGVHSEIDSLCNSLKQLITYTDYNMIPISFISVDEMSNRNLDELDPSFMYTQILKEILFEIEYDEQSMKDFIVYCQTIFEDNSVTLNKITQFEKEYALKSPVWWYTTETFIYSLLNQALRTLEVNTIIKMGFFIYDLHRQIEKLHSNQFNDKQVLFRVYRGQSLTKENFEKLLKAKSGLMSFNNFLSTSEDRDVAVLFAESNSMNNYDSVGILFEIHIDTLTSTIPFAQINQITHFNSEKELLFSMHTIFRIIEIHKIDDADNLWLVQLKVTSDNDPILSALTQHFRHEIRGDRGWYRLAKLLVKLGQLNKAEEIYETLLIQYTYDEDKKASLLGNLGHIKNEQGDYIAATMLYQKELEILKKILPRYHPRMIHAYNNCGLLAMSLGEYTKALSVFQITLNFQRIILPPDHIDVAYCHIHLGDAYDEMNDYPKALMAYETALEIYQKTLPVNHPDISSTYNRIAAIYNKMGEYTQALSVHQKVLEIRQKTLPPDHPSLSDSYSSISSLYYAMGEYSKALSNLETSVTILKKTHSSNHPDLAVCYCSMGSVYDNMGEHLKALSFYEKALQIQQETLPDDHPNLANVYNAMGSVYNYMGEWSKALLFCEKALAIYQKSLPSDHLQIATVYTNIGSIYRSTEEDSKAYSWCKKALKIYEKNLPSNHFVLLTAYHNIGRICQDMGEYSQALIYYQQALEIQERTLAPHHSSLANLYTNIADLYMKTNQYATALIYYEKALEIQEKTLPSNHIDLAMTYNGIGTAYKDMGEFTKAYAYLKRFLEISQPYLSSLNTDNA